jgi:hypothetical protein
MKEGREGGKETQIRTASPLNEGEKGMKEDEKEER